MNPNREKYNLYFNGQKDYDIFNVYDRHGTVFCSEAFVKFCNEFGINNVEFEMI